MAAPFDQMTSAPEPDLDDLKQRLARSTQAFLDALALCDADDALGEENVEPEQVAEDSSALPADREDAAGTRALLRQFRSAKVSFEANVAVVNMALNNAIDRVLSELVGDVLSSLVHEGGIPDLSESDNPAATAEALVHGAQRSTGEARAILGDADRNGMNRVAAMGENVVRVQDMTATTLLMRHATLRTFRRETPEVAWEDLLERIRPVSENAIGGEAGQLAWETVVESAGQVMDLALDEATVLRKLPNRWARSKDMRKTGLDLDDSAILHEQLKREVAIMESMDKAYQDCLVALSVPTAVTGVPLSS